MYNYFSTYLPSQIFAFIADLQSARAQSLILAFQRQLETGVELIFAINYNNFLLTFAALPIDISLSSILSNAAFKSSNEYLIFLNQSNWYDLNRVKKQCSAT